MVGFFCEPTRLLTKPEKPDFLRGICGFESLPSSEYRFGVGACDVSALRPGPAIFSDMEPSILLKLWEARKAGFGMSWLWLLILKGSGVAFDVCCSGNCHDFRDGCWTDERGLASLVDSMRFRIAAPSKGAPRRSSGRPFATPPLGLLVKLGPARNSPCAVVGDAFDDDHFAP